MSQRKLNLIERRLCQAFDLLRSTVLFDHLTPVEVHDTGEDIGVELCVLDVAEMLGEGLGRERFGLPLAAFVPPDPPALDVLSLVDPWLSHSLHSIGISDGQAHWRALERHQVESKRRHTLAQ